MEDLEKQRLLDEIAILKKKLTSGGRPHILTDEQISNIGFYRQQGRTVKEIADMFNCSMSTINRALKKLKNKQEIQKLKNEKSEIAEKSDIKGIKLIEKTEVSYKIHINLDD